MFFLLNAYCIQKSESGQVSNKAEKAEEHDKEMAAGSPVCSYICFHLASSITKFPCNKRYLFMLFFYIFYDD